MAKIIKGYRFIFSLCVILSFTTVSCNNKKEPTKGIVKKTVPASEAKSNSLDKLENDKLPLVTKETIKLMDQEPQVKEVKPVIVDLSNELYLNFHDVDRAFDKVIKTEWHRYSATTTYELVKTYIGESDNISILGIGNDDVSWNIGDTHRIVLNTDNNLVYSEKGTVGSDGFVSKVIGHIENNQGQIEFQLDIDHFIVKKSQLIKINADKFAELQAEPIKIDRTCPQMMKLVSLCDPYVYTIDVLGAIDFNAIGEAGPMIAKDVTRVKNIAGIVKSFVSFSPDINSIRDEYLVPILISIKELKELGVLDTDNHHIYINETAKTYSNLITTSLDSILKSQKMMPEVISNLAPQGLGILLAYAGAEDAGDALIARKQPKWFKEIVSPVIREFGVLTIDIIMNTSGTSMEERVGRYMEMEQQLRDSLARLCKKSSSSKNDCKRALTY